MALYTALRMIRQNKNSLELLSTIFENSSLKGSFGENKKRVEFLLLSPDSWKLLTTSLKVLSKVNLETMLVEKKDRILGFDLVCLFQLAG